MTHPRDLDADRPITRAERVALAGVLAILAVTALACDGGCARAAGSPSTLGIRDADAQNAAIALVREICPGPPDNPIRVRVGTAAIVGTHRLMTAAHMTTCPDPARPEDSSAVVAPLFIGIDDGRGGMVAATVTWSDAQRDLAVLVVEHAMQDASMVRIGPRPSVGKIACEAAAMPRLTYRCGLVQPDAAGDEHIYVDMKVEHGNSGSPLYVDGLLVGIMVMTITCQDKTYCVGAAEPVQDLGDLLK